jgi:TolA-binding protein
MNNSLKVALYALLALLAGISGYFALASFGHLMARGAERGSELEQIEPERKTGPESRASGTTGPASNQSPATVASTNQANPASVPTNAISTGLSNTNIVVAAAEQTTATNTPNADKTKKKRKLFAARRDFAAGEPAGGRHMGLWTALFVVSLVGLGLLIANDVSHYLGSRALKVLYNDEGEGLKNPDYEQAEQVWANGQHLEAISLMREYLKKNPREQHAALRIAEIYEKDLGNFLAAALEYEEVLKHKLTPERWGWAAIHLCNLYFKLNHQQKAFELLRRIVNEYPTTAAAEKARKRLEQVDGAALAEQLPTEHPENTAPKPTAAKPVQPAKAEAPSNLPPGFRPKK